jgi:hypothetical protein
LQEASGFDINPSMADSTSRDIVVFMTRSDPRCDFCSDQLGRGAWIRKVGNKAQCLECADLDHLVFLPSGDAALTRRAGKHSRLRAVVVQWARARKRYERRGTLVEEEALERAERECSADAEQREQRRLMAAVRRNELDQEFVRDFARHIGEHYPGCPAEEARRIAEHACRKHSGRVGRSAAAKEFDNEAIDLAVIARIRHAHTAYDELLAEGMFRDEARAEVRGDIDAVVRKWRWRPTSQAGEENSRDDTAGSN